MINYIDLFAGAGGLSEGFTSSGYHPIAHVEMNKDACSTLITRACYYYLNDNGKLGLYLSYLKGEISREKLLSSVPKSTIDSVINLTMSEESMPALFAQIDSLIASQGIKEVDLLVGGPPCQAYSLVGRAVKSDGMANDPRNYLYKLYIHVLKRYQPKLFVFENVPGLLTANKGGYLSDMIKAFEDAGYLLQYKVLNAADFGVLQSRLRVILIGWRQGTTFQYPCFEKTKGNYTVADALSDLPSIQAGEEGKSYLLGEYSEYLHKSGIRQKDDILTWHVSRPNLERDREIYRVVIKTWNEEKRRIKYTELPKGLCTHKNRSAFLDRFKVVAADLPTSHTMMAHISKDGHYFIHPDINQARSLSVREAARIQSFPDNFFFEGSRTAAFTQIGNAVPPLMAKGIAQELKAQFEVKNYE